jgi:hypothetical protein
MTADEQPTLYQLFDETDFRYWKRKMQQGKLPTPDQLALLLENNPGEPLPSWLRPVVVKAIRGKLKGQRGRPHKSSLRYLRFWAAVGEYRDVLARMQRADKANPKGRAATTGKGRTHPPAHQRAAEQVVSDWKLPMSWRSFLNEISPKK